MKKTISICIIAGILVIGVTVLILLFWPGTIRQKKQDPPGELVVAESETEELPMATESMTIREPYEYIILLEDGFLVVYQKDGKTKYFETNIREADIDADLLYKVQEGLYITDDKELYDYLESYSS